MLSHAPACHCHARFVLVEKDRAVNVPCPGPTCNTHQAVRATGRAPVSELDAGRDGIRACHAAAGCPVAPESLP